MLCAHLHLQLMQLHMMPAPHLHTPQAYNGIVVLDMQTYQSRNNPCSGDSHHSQSNHTQCNCQLQAVNTCPKCISRTSRAVAAAVCNISVQPRLHIHPESSTSCCYSCHCTQHDTCYVAHAASFWQLRFREPQNLNPKQQHIHSCTHLIPCGPNES